MLLLVTIQALKAQSDSIILQKFYHTWIIPEKGSKGKSGVLYQIKDSSVLVSNSPNRQDYYNNNFYTTQFDIREIKAIKVRRQGQGFAVLVGGLSGAVVGGFISAAYMDHLEKTMNPFGFAFGGFMQGILPFIVSTGIGIGIGAILSSKITIPIQGSQGQFNARKKKLNEYALTRNTNSGFGLDGNFKTFRDSVVDVDGKAYHTIVLGGQVWMAENLRVTRFRDGSRIEETSEEADATGRKYSWNVVKDSRKLCPTGWHVPSMTEWTSLYNSLGGENGASDKIQESFMTGGTASQWWSSTEWDQGKAKSFYVNMATRSVMLTSTAKTTELPVRCLRDN